MGATLERYASAEDLSAIFSKIEEKLQNRYTKAATDAAITEAIEGIVELDYQVVTQLPAQGTKGVVYLVPDETAGSNSYDEYIWIIVEGTGNFVKLGARTLDISNKLEKADIKVSTSMTKTDDASGNGFTLDIKVDGTTITKDATTGALKVSDDFQAGANVEHLTSDQVNALKAIFTNDPTV